MIECENICVRRNGRFILKDVSFSCTKGSVTALIGKNGCGKTTLLRAIDGLQPYSGAIRLNGAALCDLKRPELAKIIALMPQVLPLPPVKVRRLVSFGRSPYTGLSGILSPQDIEITETELREAEIEALAEQYVDQLSGGERRKAYFAMLLAQRTPILLLDEPTANLDPAYQSKMLRWISERKAQNQTVITVLHDINQAFALADQLIVLEEGVCLFSGSSEEARVEKIPERLFSMRELRCKDDAGREMILYQ